MCKMTLGKEQADGRRLIPKTLRQFFLPAIAAPTGERLRAFGRDRRGGILILMALALVPLLGMVGLALDSARSYLIKSRLSSALDAAGLAAARSKDPDQIAADVQKYFNANFPNGYLGATVDGPHFVLSNDDQVIALDVTATINTTFMKLVGLGDINIGADAEVSRAIGLTDIVFAIDMSGSMDDPAGGGGGGTRIEAARAAAITLVNHLFGDQLTNDNLKIGLVPWNSKVNVSTNGAEYDPDATSTTDVPEFQNPITGANQTVLYNANNSQVPLLFDPPDDWNGCVFARYKHDGNSSNDGDTSYGPGSFGNLYWPAWEPTEVPFEQPGYWHYHGGKNHYHPPEMVVDEDSQCLSHGITPLQNTKAAITNAINELTNPDGATNIPQGLLWAWRVLMPEEPFTDAEANPDPVPYRVIVLLTDGENCGSSDDAYKGQLGGCSGARASLNTRLQTIAGKIKAAGITIIAIQFANNGTALQTLMQGVASSNSAPHYFYAPDGDALEDVFDQIGEYITEVHLSK